MRLAFVIETQLIERRAAPAQDLSRHHPQARQQSHHFGAVGRRLEILDDARLNSRLAQ
jgi:hypothetical protein